MLLPILIFVFVSSVVIFILHNSFKFQIFLRNLMRRKVLAERFVSKTRGEFFSTGYFSTNSHVVSELEYSKLLVRQRVNLSKCYSIVKFKTVDADWELFFHLVKEQGKFKEYVFLKCYVHNNWIHSRGNVEKCHSRFEKFASHRTLMGIFERHDISAKFDHLLKENGDLFIVLDKLISVKCLVKSKKVSSTKLLHNVQAINFVKNHVYRSGNIEY